MTLIAFRFPNSMAAVPTLVCLGPVIYLFMSQSLPLYSGGNNRVIVAFRGINMWKGIEESLKAYL